MRQGVQDKTQIFKKKEAKKADSNERLVDEIVKQEYNPWRHILYYEAIQNAQAIEEFIDLIFRCTTKVN